MKKASAIYAVIAFFACLTACDKAPNGIISERKMTNLLVDINKATALIELNPDQYPTDSTKQVLKQSVFEKHGISKELYDSSMVWYAHNIEVYQDVCQRVVDKLEKENKKALRESANAFNSPTPQQSKANTNVKPYHTNHGDTADLWVNHRSYVFLPGHNSCRVSFDIEPNSESISGDRYTLNFKALPFRNVFRILLAADYTNGKTSIVTRSISGQGWNRLELQTDSTAQMRRVYGYISFTATPTHFIAYLDSIALLRTHLNQRDYYSFITQITLDKNAKGDNSSKSIPEPQELPKFKPKPGVNKSGVHHNLNINRR